MTQNRFFTTKFWWRNQNSSLKVYYSDEIYFIAKRNKNVGSFAMENKAIVKKIFVTKAGTINKLDSDFLLKPYHFFCLHRLLSPPLSIELHHCQKDVVDTISVDVLKITVIRSFDASINCIFPTWYKITYSKYFFSS